MNKEVHEVRDGIITEGARRPLPKWMIASIVSASVLSSFAVIYFFILPILSLFGGPSTEERYYYINNTLEAIDYENTGTVLESSYDDESHWASKARFQSTIEGDESFEELSKRVIESSPVNCSVSAKLVSCIGGRPSINLHLEPNGTTILKLSDSGAGK